MTTPTMHRNRTLDIRSARILDTAGASAILELETDEGTRRAFLRFSGRKTMAKHIAGSPATELLGKAKAAVVDGPVIDTYGNVPGSLLPKVVDDALRYAEVGRWPVAGIVPSDFSEVNRTTERMPLHARHHDLVLVKQGYDAIGVFDRSGMKWSSVISALARQGDLGPEAMADLDLADRMFRVLPVHADYDGPVNGTARRRERGTAPTTDRQREHHAELLKRLRRSSEDSPISDLKVESTIQIASLEDEHSRRSAEGSLPASERQIGFANAIAERLGLERSFDRSTAPETHAFIVSHKDIGQLVDASDAKVFALMVGRAAAALDAAKLSFFTVSQKRLVKAGGHVESAVAGDTELQIDRVEYGARFADELDALERKGLEPTLMRPREGEVFVRCFSPDGPTARIVDLASFAGTDVLAWCTKVADAMLAHPDRISMQRTYLRERVIRDIVTEIVVERKASAESTMAPAL